MAGFLLFGAAGARAQDPIALGVYWYEDNNCYIPQHEQAFTDLQQLTGRLAKLYINFQGWSSNFNKFPAELGDKAIAHGGILMVTWMPNGPPGGFNPHWSCAAIAAGEHDDYIRQYATDAAAWGKPLMIRFAHEMNGDWSGYGTAYDLSGQRRPGNAPSDFVAMWQHVWGIFHDAHVTNVTWVWCPNVIYINPQNSPDQARDDIKALYPGDDYVDWIALDGYNNGTFGKWRSFYDVFDDSYRAVTVLTDKPLMIAEFGCTEEGAPPGTSKADWITHAFMDDIPRLPRIRLVSWFNHYVPGKSKHNFNFNTSPEATAAYRAAVNSPFCQSEIVPNPNTGK